jgi:hypothetical protein
VAPAPRCLTCVWRMRGARWCAKSLKIKGFYSDITTRIAQKTLIHGRIHIVRTLQGFMHIIPTPPHHVAHTYPPLTHHITHHPSASHHARRTQRAHHVALSASREAVLLIRSTRPKSNVADSFSLKNAILGPSEDKYP